MTCHLRLGRWPRYINECNVYSADALAASPPAMKHSLTRFALMPKISADGTFQIRRLALTITLALKIDMLAGLRDPCLVGAGPSPRKRDIFFPLAATLSCARLLRTVDGQFLHSLTEELRDENGHLVAPDDFMRNQVYQQASASRRASLH